MKEFKIDITGIDLFFEVVDIFLRGDMPNNLIWNKIFSNQGYKTLTKSEFSEDFFKSKWKDAFYKQVSNDRYTRHYLNTLKHRKDIIKIKNEANVLQKYAFRADQLAKKYLPPSNDYNVPSISFNTFDYDARGYNPIIFDPLFYIKEKEMMALWLAHEFHHFYHYQLLKPLKFKNKYEDLEYVLRQIHIEGVADLINILPNKTGNNKRVRKQLDLMKLAPKYLVRLNTLIKEAAQTNNFDQTGRVLKRELPMSGHSIGFYITSKIIQNKGKKGIIDSLDDTLSFLNFYINVEEEYLEKDTVKILESI